MKRDDSAKRRSGEGICLDGLRLQKLETGGNISPRLMEQLSDGYLRRAMTWASLIGCVTGRGFSGSMASLHLENLL